MLGVSTRETKMTDDNESTDHVVAGGRVGRRSFLTKLATVAAASGMVSTIASKADAATAPPDPSTAMRVPIAGGGQELVQIKHGQTYVSARFAKDGLLPRFVSGQFAGTDRGSLVVAVDTGIGEVRVVANALTAVTAGGRTTVGDISALKVGDRLNIGTYFDALDRRVAEYVRANVVLGSLIVSKSDATGVWGTWLRNPGAGVINFKYQDDTGVPDVIPAPGELWRVFATSSSSVAPESMWILDLHALR
jgi:hypothetical protein